MKQLFRLLFLITALTIFSCNDSAALTGAWSGKLTYGQFKIPLVFNFSENADGHTACTLESPSQGTKGIPTTVSLCTADSIALECPMIGARFNAAVTPDSISGTFTQRGMSFPLTLTPEASAEERRPQTPKPPYPYTTIDTTFCSTDGTLLSGTLTLPANYRDGKVPAVVMVTGSGPQNRDEELFDHKPFAVIADYLARNGVASLRYDDRGTGESKGDFSSSTTYTFKDDARSAIDFLRTMPMLGKVGILGHSEGGTIALVLGADKVPDFIISLAGMAVSGKETILRQNSRHLDSAGLSDDAKANSIAIIGKVLDMCAQQACDGVSTPIDIDSLIATSEAEIPAPIIASLKSAQKVRTPWLDTFLNIDPRPILPSITCPVLALNGDKDTQVDASTNIQAIRAALPQAQACILTNLNHLLQHATTGEVTEYSEIRETISPEALHLILTFITNNFPSR